MQVKKLQNSKYKYEVTRTAIYRTGIMIRCPITHKYFTMSTDGSLAVYPGYQWDGATGGIDTKNFRRASLFHDVLCQMMNEGLLDRAWQKRADEILWTICREDGMSKIRAWWVHKAVRAYDFFIRRWNDKPSN